MDGVVEFRNGFITSPYSHPLQCKFVVSTILIAVLGMHFALVNRILANFYTSTT